MNAAIFNRADFEHPADGQYQIESKGIHPNLEAGVEQMIDDPACDSIANQFNADADAGRLPQGREMLIDHEHFKDQVDKETIAYGWLQRLQSRADGIYGQIRWTAIGRAAVDGGNYRFFSSEYDREDLVALGGTPARFRPMRLAGLTLTNMPNNKGGKPITNRAVARPRHLSQASDPRAAQHAAVKRIGQLANEEQRSSGGSLASAYMRIMNRESTLARVATGIPGAEARHDAPRETLGDPAAFAGQTLLRLAQARNLPGLGANMTCIRNRFPRLARMVNRQAGWDALADLEPEAHAAYLQAVQRLRDDVFPKSRWEDFLATIDDLALAYPDLGYEGRYDKFKELYPKRFWSWVLTFDGQRQSNDGPFLYGKDEQDRLAAEAARQKYDLV